MEAKDAPIRGATYTIPIKGRSVDGVKGEEDRNALLAFGEGVVLLGST
jgi:hypothetical protein